MKISDCQGVKSGQFKNLGGRVYIFEKIIKMYVNNIVSGV